jgi:hypothetical protein
MSQPYKEIIEFIRIEGILSEGFQNWAWADQSGRTVAHEAAKYGHLPPDFDRWEFALPNGWTVAHVAYTYKHLPKDSPLYDVVQRTGDNRDIFSRYFM